MGPLRRIALAAVALLPTALWLAGQRSSSAAVAHGLLLVPSTSLAAAGLLLALRARHRLAALADRWQHRAVEPRHGA